LNSQNHCKPYPEQGKNVTHNVRDTHNKHLRDPNVAAQYLNEALEENDPAVILMALRNIAAAQQDKIGRDICL
jgi:DNA-binding phage protein